MLILLDSLAETLYLWCAWRVHNAAQSARDQGLVMGLAAAVALQGLALGIGDALQGQWKLGIGQALALFLWLCCAMHLLMCLRMSLWHLGRWLWPVAALAVPLAWVLPQGAANTVTLSSTLKLHILVSMLAYATQDLILEPFGGLMFGLTPGETTRISGLQHGGILIGMAMVGILGSLFAKGKPMILKGFIFFGCVASAFALAGLSLSALLAPAWPLKANIFLLGVANGAFAVAAIGAMMMLASGGDGASEGIRMGVWGAAQAVSFGLGGVIGTVAIDITRALTGDTPLSFAVVFGLEAGLFLMAAAIALLIKTPARSRAGDGLPSAYAVPAE